MAEIDLLTGLLPWQVPVANSLVESYVAGSLHPALLLCGHESSGKRRFAREVSAALLCELNQPANNARATDTASLSDAGTAQLPVCGKCRSCQLVLANTHPDLYQLGIPEGKKIIPIDGVRELQVKLRQTAQMQGARVCIIWPAEALNENAANALLKLLEEPPAETYFLLLANSSQQLLPTINSRCLKIQLLLPRKAEIKSWLQQAYPVEAVTEALELSRGFPERALQILQLEAQPVAVEALAERLLGKTVSLPELATALESVSPELFLDALSYRVHQWSLDCALRKPTGEAGAQGRSLHSLLVLQDWLADCRARLAGNPNKKLFVDDLLLGTRRLLEG